MKRRKKFRLKQGQVYKNEVFVDILGEIHDEITISLYFKKGDIFHVKLCNENISVQIKMEEGENSLHKKDFYSFKKMGYFKPIKKVS